MSEKHQESMVPRALPQLAPSDTVINKELFAQLTELFQLAADGADGGYRAREAWPPIREWYEREMNKPNSEVSIFYKALLDSLEEEEIG